MILIVYAEDGGEIEFIISPAPKGDIPEMLIPTGCKHILREASEVRDLDAVTHRVSADGRIIKKPQGSVDAYTYQAAMDEIRRQRDALLTGSDWTQMPDSPHTPEERQAWSEYRQALRDMPNQVEDPAFISWPKPPSNP